MVRFLIRASGRRLAAFAVTMLVGIGAMAGAARADGDPSNGGRLMNAKCSTCHNWQPGGPNRIGPNLFGVVGRKAGTKEAFAYTDGMRSLGVVWSPELLASYLAAPSKMVPGTKMTFPGLADAKQAADVVAFLNTLR